MCRLPRAQVAAAFTTTRYTGRTPRHVRDAYAAWKTALHAFDITFDGRLSAARQ
ncbi:hypothetical protein [Streptomyces sp. NPDC058622]|uniref:hypothetical protein n=1 Tax=Streptomyces sp. NPDC058622 TaxID=3346562 RepID=UPI003653A3A6